MIESAVSWLLSVLAVPKVGLTSVFFISFLSATLLPLGSEPAVFAVIKANGALFWPIIVTASIGNVLGGIVDYWIGYGAKHVLSKDRETRWLKWPRRFGAKTLLFSWLPGVGDPLCTLAGWLKLPFWPCVFYMATGKFLRYLLMTISLLHVPDGFWRQLGSWLV